MTDGHYGSKFILFLSTITSVIIASIGLNLYEEINAKKKIIPELCNDFVNSTFKNIVITQLILSIIFLVFLIIYSLFKIFGKTDKIKLGNIDNSPKLLRTLVIISLLTNITFLVLYVSYTTTFEVCFPDINNQLDSYDTFKSYVTWTLIILSTLLFGYLYFIYYTIFGKEEKKITDIFTSEKDKTISDLKKQLEESKKEKPKTDDNEIKKLKEKIENEKDNIISFVNVLTPTQTKDTCVIEKNAKDNLIERIKKLGK